MGWVVLVVRTAALAVAIGALTLRADCAFVTRTCLGTNLFSYFTVHSTILLILVLGLTLIHHAHRGAEPVWLTAFRALATTYMIVSGVVFTIMLANAELFGYLFLVPSSSKVLHFVLPVYAVADFLLGPGRHRLAVSTAWTSMVYPVLWAAYTLVRGRLVGWYPYFFLDPDQVGGYTAVGLYSLGVSALILTTALLVAAATRLPSLPARPLSPAQRSSGHRGHQRRGV
ncbi:Pr6Pr family membrane protein [Kocuria sp. NPDC057446]|uniref:Pr6Pr family membrane protein n=1 Tax=Kocuria sp. NPDC057446 TaxID=3346137 RepID=UPI0036D0B5F6